METLDTSDGSRTLHSARYGEAYRSLHGALSESLHVFLTGSGVLERLGGGPATLSVLEVGFGTGLNFLVTACATLTANTGKAFARETRLTYTALENDLPPLAAIRGLDYAGLLAPCPLPADLLARLAALGDPPPAGRHSVETRRHPAITLQLVVGDALDFVPRTANSDADRDGDGDAARDLTYDAIYLDPFSPKANPDLWSDEFLSRLASWLAPGGRLVTYSVSGDARRSLAAAGLNVAKVPGPAGGKREVLAALKPTR